MTGKTAVTLTPEQATLCLELARAAVVESTGGPDCSTQWAACRADPRLMEDAACFVTLRKYDDLRGCIGNMEPTGPLCDSVRRNAIQAATQDPRFDRVAEEELHDLHIDITVLGPREAIEGPEQIQVGHHGVLLEKNGRRAVFLPQVATDFGWTREELLQALSRKAGLPVDAWEQGASFQVFEGREYAE